jgi:hypothetical protein
VREGFIMAKPKTAIFVYGFSGTELEIASYIKTRVCFAVADEQKTRLAWYLYSETSGMKGWKEAFTQATSGVKKLDRVTVFARAKLPNPNRYDFDFTFHIDELIPRKPHSGWGYASLFVNDSSSLTSFVISIASSHPFAFAFDLPTESKRRTPNGWKSGYIYNLLYEPFSEAVLESGPSRDTILHDFGTPVYPSL